jgi:Ig-like domain-containing protein
MKIKSVLSIIFIAMLIAACSPSPASQEQGPTPDIAAVRTSAASTVIAQFTLTAAAFTPTASLPTETSAPQITNTATIAPLAQVTTGAGTTVALCDSLSIDPTTVDVNIPDGTTMTPGQDFIKTWKVKNNGSCAWGAGYELIYAGYADQMAGQFQPLDEVIQPGQETELSVQFQAPDAAGEYVSAWQMSNPAGQPFEEIIFVKILVQ